MSVVNVSPLWSQFDLRQTDEGWTGKKVFSVQLDGSDSLDDAGFVALGADDVPSLYAAWSAGRTYLRCTSRSPSIKTAPSNGLVEVTCSYSTGPESEDPLNEPADVSWGSMSVTQALEYDRDGDLIANTAGDPLELEEEFRLPVLKIARNVATHGIANRGYENTVNENSILGAVAETLWLRTYDADRVIEGDDTYWRENIEIVYNPFDRPEGGGKLGWDRRLANVGKRVWQQISGVWTRVNLKDAEGEPIDSPAPLNADGTAQLDKGEDTIWLYFQTKRAKNWRPLNLDEIDLT